VRAFDHICGGKELLAGLISCIDGRFFLRPESKENGQLSQLFYSLESLVVQNNKVLAFAYTIEILQLIQKCYGNSSGISSVALSKTTKRVIDHLKAHYQEKITVSQLSESSVEKKVSDIPLREPAFLSGEKKVFTAAEKGTILHRILEHIPFTSESADPGAVSIYIKEMIGKGLLTEEEAAWADIPAICGFFASELGQRACRSDQVFREMPFVARFDREELLRAGAREDLHTEEKVLVQGTIDCFFLEDGKAVILDFKSGYAPPTDEGEAKLLDRYRTQLLLYGEALKKVRKIPVEEIHLYSFYLQKDFQL